MDLIARVLSLVPPWTRVYRIQRDIPMPLVTSGVEKGNLRELALARMDDLGLKCRDVRTREAGIQVFQLSFEITFVIGNRLRKPQCSDILFIFLKFHC